MAWPETKDGIFLGPSHGVSCQTALAELIIAARVIRGAARSCSELLRNYGSANVSGPGSAAHPAEKGPELFNRKQTRRSNSGAGRCYTSYESLNLANQKGRKLGVFGRKLGASNSPFFPFSKKGGILEH